MKNDILLNKLSLTKNVLKELSKKPLILASSSPHRAKLLSKYFIPFVAISPQTNEYWNNQISNRQNLIYISQQKVKTIAKQYPSRIILGADTVVINHEGKHYSKPQDVDTAKMYLSKRNDSYEIINTGFTLYYKQHIISDVIQTKVTYNQISQSIQDQIINTNEWVGVCGGLKIEGCIQESVKEIKGEYENIIGLPIQRITSLINKLITKIQK